MWQQTHQWAYRRQPCMLPLSLMSGCFLFQRSGKQTPRELIMCVPKQAEKPAPFQMPDNKTQGFSLCLTVIRVIKHLLIQAIKTKQQTETSLS